MYIIRNALVRLRYHERGTDSKCGFHVSATLHPHALITKTQYLRTPDVKIKIRPCYPFQIYAADGKSLEHFTLE